MDNYSLFDIIGPVMIGPSSSHTAGASKIGFMAAQIFDDEIVAVDFYLHGSFYKTAKGHGTDKALLAGILKLKPDDEDIRNAFEMAEKSGIEYHFYREDLGEVHANSVRIVMTAKSGHRESVEGSSVGAGRILITRIGDTEVEVDGDYFTLITTHHDRPGIIAKVSTILALHQINIAFMKVFRHSKGDNASLIVQVDDTVDEEILEEIHAVRSISAVKFIKALGDKA